MRHRHQPNEGADDNRCLHERCLVAPSPDAQERPKDKLRETADRAGLAAGQVGLVPLDRGGFNDGLIKPGTDLPLGTPLRVARRARAGAAEGARARVLVDFSDKAMTRSKAHFEELFFSTGKLPHGSVREYFSEVSSGNVTIAGEVIGRCGCRSRRQPMAPEDPALTIRPRRAGGARGAREAGCGRRRQGLPEQDREGRRDDDAHPRPSVGGGEARSEDGRQRQRRRPPRP
jgi:hypothetical protein